MPSLRDLFIITELKRVLDALHELKHEEKEGRRHIMAAFDDLKTKIADVQTSVSAEIQAVSDKLSSLPTGGTSDAQIAEAIASLDSVKSTLDAETAALRNS